MKAPHVLFASKVSSATENDYMSVLCSSTFRTVDFPHVFASLKVFYSKPSRHDSALNAAGRMRKSVLNDQQSSLIFNRRITHDDESEPTLVSRVFNPFYDWWCTQHTDSTVFHEHELYTKSPIDFLFVRSQNNFAVPTLIVEWVKQSTTKFSKKVHQLRQQARNAFQLFPDTCAGCIMGVLIDVATFEFEVHILQEVKESQKISFASHKLISKTSGAELARLLRMMAFWCKAQTKDTRYPALTPIPALGMYSKVRFWQHIVYKEYDYRNTSVSIEDRRQERHTLDFVKGAKRVVTSTDMNIISYPFIEGSHEAINALQFKPVVDTLLKVHEKKLVFGDLHRFNIVFDSKDKEVATVIDFDYARKINAQYISGFARELKNAGQRHPNARAGSEMKVEHDWFSLAAVMDLFQVQDDKNEEAYARYVTNVRSGKKTVFQDIPIMLKSSCAGEPSTGSPKRVPRSRTESVSVTTITEEVTKLSVTR
jgi:hypothetical protein